MAEHLEVKPRARKPAWTEPGDKPLFTFAWLSDFHLSTRRFEQTRTACRYVDQVLKPNFAIITGDNNAYAPPVQASSKDKPSDIATRRQIFFKDFLAKHLKTPSVVIPGDNWPWAFEKVHGAFQFSFDFGGVHFLFSTLDRSGPGTEGCALFDASTWQWMLQDLKANRQRPTIFLMHESVLPPTFLDALRVRQMLRNAPNVIACFCGHMHLDLDFNAGHVRYLVCPAVGPSARHGFKHCAVYRHAIILTTHEYDTASKSYRAVPKWQKIDIPEGLRPALIRPSFKAFRKENYREIPPHPRRRDAELNKRASELFAPLMMFLAEFGVKGVLFGGTEP